MFPWWECTALLDRFTSTLDLASQTCSQLLVRRCAQATLRIGHVVWRMPALRAEVKAGVATETQVILRVGSGVLFGPWEPSGREADLVREGV